MTTKSGNRTTAARGKAAPSRTAVTKSKKSAPVDLMPLDYMLRVLRNEEAAPEERRWAAQQAAPYVHPKLSAVEHSGGTGGSVRHEASLDPALRDLIDRVLARGKS